MHVALVGCSKNKKEGEHKARDMYTSPLFRKSLAYAEAIADEVFVISSYYELTPTWKVIQSYDDSLYDKTRDVRAAWGDRIVNRLNELTPLIADGSPFEITILAGDTYVRPIKRSIQVFGLGWIINDPLKGLSVGERLRWLNQAMESLNDDDRSGVPARRA